MLNKVVTLEQVLSLNLYYSKEKLLEISEGKTELTIGEIIDLRFVSAENKLWLLLREEIIPARTLHEFALWCAETALTRTKVTDERSWNALKVKRLWLDGKATDEELDAAMVAARDAAGVAAPPYPAYKVAARAAAWSAARDTTKAAAKSAARDAIWLATWSAAASAAGSAAESATRDAVWSAAKSAAMDEQLAKLKEMLEEKWEHGEV
jgi:hypothetical protein